MRRVLLVVVALLGSCSGSEEAEEDPCYRLGEEYQECGPVEEIAPGVFAQHCEWITPCYQCAEDDRQGGGCFVGDVLRQCMDHCPAAEVDL